MKTVSVLALWREANRKAIDAQTAFLEKGLLYARGVGEAPTEAEKEQVRALELIATGLYETAMAAFSEPEKIATLKGPRQKQANSPHTATTPLWGSGGSGVAES
jgi:hypothetical protein